MQKDKAKDAAGPPVEDTVGANRPLRKIAVSPGRDPYQRAVTKKPSSKRDLRKLSEWIEARRRAEAAKRENGSGD
jgi:hypothetical protein